MKNYTIIKQKLALLKKYDTNFTVFGSSGHEYQLGEKFSEEPLKEYETKFGLTLPESYRNHLIHIGNGGTGPGYGLNPLSLPQESGGEDVEDLNDEDIQHQIQIVHHGCALFSYLILSGPNAGEVWHDDGDEMYFKISDDFGAWYEHWLNQAFFEKGFIVNIGLNAVNIGQKGEFTEALDLFKLMMSFDYNENYLVRDDVMAEYLKAFCNVLYFLQNDNTGLPVNHELNNFFLDKSMAWGEKNPAIYFNAACVYNEMAEFDKVVECIDLAREFYDGYDMMIEAIKAEPVFAAFRSADKYASCLA